MNLVGTTLIAPPALQANFWHKSVILITEQHEGSHIGVILNKRSELTVRALGDQLGLPLNYPGYVYVGGPVNKRSLGFLHTNEWRCKNTLQINNELAISSADDIMPRLSLGDCPKKWRILLGMCGWAPHQLAGEIVGEHPWKHETSWCYASPKLDLVFKHDEDVQWKNMLNHSGVEFARTVL